MNTIRGRDSERPPARPAVRRPGPPARATDVTRGAGEPERGFARPVEHDGLELDCDLQSSSRWHSSAPELTRLRRMKSAALHGSSISLPFARACR